MDITVGYYFVVVSDVKTSQVTWVPFSILVILCVLLMSVYGLCEALATNDACYSLRDLEQPLRVPLNGGWRKHSSDSSLALLLALFTTERWDALRLRVEFSKICLNIGQCKLQVFSFTKLLLGLKCIGHSVRLFYSVSFQYSFLSFEVSSGHYHAPLRNPSLVCMNFLNHETKTYEVVSHTNVPMSTNFETTYIYI